MVVKIDPFKDGPAGGQGPRDTSALDTVNALKEEAASIKQTTTSSTGVGEESPTRRSDRASLTGRVFGSPSAPQPGADNDFGQFEAFKTQIAKRNKGR